MRPHALIALLLLIAGCTTTSTTTPGRRTVPANTKATAEHAVAAGECETRLHEIGGTLLLYYALNRDLPATLADLQTLADADRPMELACPASQQPYIYIPAGLAAPGGTKLLILHDAVPSHNGSRWCVFLAPSGLNPRASQSIEVLNVAEQVFQTYRARD